jgi:hypothetical protein
MQRVHAVPLRLEPLPVLWPSQEALLSKQAVLDDQLDCLYH